MELKIGETIRHLRREKDVTQEEFAAVIGVSAQAVSKWERLEGYPDITLLPGIARYFDVSLDTLCGMDTAKEQEEIEAILIKARDPNLLCSEKVTVLRQGLEKYPHSHAIMAELAYFLMGCAGHEKYTEYVAESVRLHEYLLEHCTDGEIRKNLQANICEAYRRNSQIEKAKEMAKNLPNQYKTMEVTMSDLLSGEELADFLQKEAFQRMAWCFWYWIRRLCSTDAYSVEEKLALHQKAVAVYEIIYEHHDHNYGLLRELTSYQDMAELVADNGMPEQALAFLEKAAEYALLHDALPLGEYRPESLLINRITINREWGEPVGGTPCRKLLAGDLRTESRYDGLREDSRFQAVLASLET